MINSTTKIANFQFYFTAMGQAIPPMAVVCYTVALTAVTKAETLVFCLPAPGKSVLQNFIATLRYATPRYGWVGGMQKQDALNTYTTAEHGTNLLRDPI
jgi:ABC-type proline/glycine betaine transport system permease subunit